MTQAMLHPGVKWLWRAQYLFGAIILSGFVGIWGGGLVYAILSNNQPMSLKTVFVMIAAFVLAMVIITIINEVYLRLAYNRWFYELTPEGLKIEKGIIWKRYSSIPYERIQNIDIRRGIFARYFDYSELNIQTAGYSGMPTRGAGIYGSEGYIPAVDMKHAEEIRDFILKKIARRTHSQGL